MIDWLRHCDRELFLFINSHHNATFDWIMWQVSVPLVSLPLYIYILYRIFKKYPRNIVWYAFLTIIVSVGLSNTISSEILKPIVHRLRPSHVPELQKYIHLIRNYSGGMYGFASSHAANMTAIAVCTTYFFTKRTISYITISWALLISYSRIYLGVHYPGDVFAGILIGICVSLLCLTVFGVISQRRK